MAAIAARAGVMKLTHAPTQAELHSLMRFSPRAAARERDGLDLELFFTPAVAARIGRRRHASARAQRGGAAAHGRDDRPRQRRGTAAQRARPVPAARRLAGGRDVPARRGVLRGDRARRHRGRAGHGPAQRADRGRPVPPRPAAARRCPATGTPASPRCAASCWPRSGRTAGRAHRLLPARVADPRARAPEPAARAARAAARDRSLPGDDPAQPAVAQPGGPERAARGADPRRGLRQHRRGDGRAAGPAGRGALRPVRAG